MQTNRSSSLRLGDIAPDFAQNSTEGKIDSFHKWIGDSWCILCSHPRAFTPVCTTELGYLSKIMPEFKKRDVKVIAVSVDSAEDDIAWSKDIEEVTGYPVNYPIISDEDQTVSQTYGMLMPGDDLTAPPETVRSVFIIAPDKKIKLTITYPPSTGRNFDEILRVIDSLQLTYNRGVATPVNWKQGEKCVVLPRVKDEEAEKLFGGFEKIKPYLRLVDPDNFAKY